MRLRWYFDENIDSRKLRDRLSGRGFICESHVARFGVGRKDEDWVPTLCAERKIILTADRGRDGKMDRLVHDHGGLSVVILPKLKESGLHVLVERLVQPEM